MVSVLIKMITRKIFPLLIALIDVHRNVQRNSTLSSLPEFLEVV